MENNTQQALSDDDLVDEACAATGWCSVQLSKAWNSDQH